MNTKELVSCLQAMNLIKITPDKEAILCPQTPAKVLARPCPPAPRIKKTVTGIYTDRSAVRSLNATLNATV